MTYDRDKLIQQCAEEHWGAECWIVSEAEFDTPYEDGRNIGEVELRYRHPGLRDDIGGRWIVEPGRLAGALYGVYTDGSFGLFAD